MYPPNATHLPTKNAWLDLIDEAQTSIEIASFYWSLRFNEEYPYNSSIEVSWIQEMLRFFLECHNTKLDLVCYNIGYYVKSFCDFVLILNITATPH